MRHHIIDSTKLNIIFDFEKLLDYSDFRRTDGGGFHLLSRQDKNRSRKGTCIVVVRFSMCIGTQYVFNGKGRRTSSDRHRLSGLDRYRCGGGCRGRDSLFSRACHILENLFHHDVDSFNHRTKSVFGIFILIFTGSFTGLSEPWNEAHSGLCNE